MARGELFRGYEADAPDDEMFDAVGELWPAYRELAGALDDWSLEDYEQRKARADLALLSAGITFNVYSEEEGTERIFPFSLIPRVVGASEWESVDEGLKQRLRALNLFLEDLYGEQRILKEKVVPEEIVLSSPGYKPEMEGFRPPLGVYAHIAGCDLVRDESASISWCWRTTCGPLGVLVLENRTVMLRVVPDLFPRQGVQAVTDYPNQLLATLLSSRPEASEDVPRAVLLTPGIYNSAYFEHSFLSKQMGIALVEGSDLTVGDDNCVYLRSTTGLERVDVVYRRIDDEFLDPLVYRPDSQLGVPGLMRAYLAGNVTLANAPGAGVADDKVVYRWVPEMIRFYLREEPILQNVETFSALIPSERDHIRKHARELVLKPANASGGYGVLIGEQATEAELEETLAQVEAEPRNWIAQPLLHFSTIPTFDSDQPPRGPPAFVLSRRRWDDTCPGGVRCGGARRVSIVVNRRRGVGARTPGC